jgi:hypothetical protein
MTSTPASRAAFRQLPAASQADIRNVGRAMAPHRSAKTVNVTFTKAKPGPEARLHTPRLRVRVIVKAHG